MALVYAIVKARDGRLDVRDRRSASSRSPPCCSSRFVLIELRAKAPLVRLSIFRIRSLTTANVVMFLVASGMFAMFFFNTLYIQRVLGYGPLEGRARVPAVHGRDHGLGRARVAVRADGSACGRSRSIGHAPRPRPGCCC